MSQDIRKERSAIEAFDLIKPNIQRDSVIGIGTGSTTCLLYTSPSPRDP